MTSDSADRSESDKSTPDATPREPLPAQIGPYRILDVLGVGGMGTVYLADQKDPVRRRVAIKVIKLGMDSKAVLGRFALERQALAVMSHEAIAKVLDAGTTERGQPYFVMELVEGAPLAAYCDEHRLTLEQRIVLFQRVCEGVAHAHQKGVIHRDLKPGNVLVARKGDAHAPKIIDFGVARAADRQLVDQTIFTEQGLLIGTPEYMSPEQAAGKALEIDTRTDVYSLGVMLYELLSGELPFSAHELRAAGLLEIQRKLKEDEPPKPSTRLTTLGGRASEHAHKRRISVPALQKELRQDLDWIVLKAIAKEPERRYDSPLALAQDLARYLAHQPVLAGSPSAGYRIKKFVRRYRVQVAAAAAVLIAIVAGGIGMAWFALDANEKAEEIGRQKGELQVRANEIERQRAALQQRKDEFDMVASVVHLRTAREKEERLYPPWPGQTPAMRDWLDQDAKQLRDSLPKLRDTVEALKARAVPLSDAEREADRLAHPEFEKLQRERAHLASLRRACAVAHGEPAIEVPPIAMELKDADAKTLNEYAWVRVAERRVLFGEESHALAAAQGALARMDSGDTSVPAHIVFETLAWAYVSVGRCDEAIAEAKRVLEAGPEKAKGESCLKAIETTAAALRGDAAMITSVEAEVAALEARVGQRRTFRFAADADADRFLFETLHDLVPEIERFEREQRASVEERLAWADKIQALSIDAHQARWHEARAAIAASGRYREHALDLEPQIGLVPIGMNPQTGLWEFYDLRLAKDPSVIPAHRADGSLEVTGDTGIVFVLVPGGTFTMGAQRVDPSAPNCDQQAESDETLHRVKLAPFLLSRYELTQGQWQRLTGREPSFYRQSNMPLGIKIFTLANPVEQLSWEECDRWLPRDGLALPSEAQWEYACRAETTTPHCCALAKLVRHANVADATAKAGGATWPCEVWEDGHAAHSPVGSFLPNGFGLFDMHGNVWEWTCDPYNLAGVQPRDGDGLRGDPARYEDRVIRGGSYNAPARDARSAVRRGSALSSRGMNLGVRPIRIITADVGTSRRR